MEEIKDQVTTDTQETPNVDPTPQIEANEVPQPEKKKRGPKGPRTPKAPDASVIPRKGKGGEAASAKEEKTSKDSITKTAEFYARQVEGMHMMASMLTGLDLSIKSSEAQTLGEAIYLVVKEYDLEFISKYAPLLNLAATTLMVEVPVVMRATEAVKVRKAAQGEAKAKTKLQGPGVEVGTPLQVVSNFPGGEGLGQVISG